MQTKDICDMLGIGANTLRLYEKKNLIHPSRKKENGYHEYDAEDVFSLLLAKKYQSQGNTLSQILRMTSQDDFDTVQDKLAAQIRRAEEELNELTFLRDLLKHIHAGHERNYVNQYQVSAEKEKWYSYQCILCSSYRDIPVEEASLVMRSWGQAFSHLNVVIILHLDSVTEDGFYPYSLGVVTHDICMLDELADKKSIQIIPPSECLVYPVVLEDPFHVAPVDISSLLEYAKENKLGPLKELHMNYNLGFQENGHIMHLLHGMVYL